MPLEELLADADLALIVTTHPGIDYDADRPARAPCRRPARGHALLARGQRRAPVTAGRAPRAGARRADADDRAGLLLGERVSVGAEVQFGAHVVVHDGTVIGDGCVIEDHVVLGKRPRLAARSSARGEIRALVLGERVTVCAGAVVFAGARIGDDVIIGDQSFVRERARIGDGSRRSVAAASSITTSCVGARVRVQTNVYLTALTLVEDDVFVGAGRDDDKRRHDGAPPARRRPLRGADSCDARCRVGGGAVLPPASRSARRLSWRPAPSSRATCRARAVVMGVPARVVREVPRRTCCSSVLALPSPLRRATS